MSKTRVASGGIVRQVKNTSYNIGNNDKKKKITAKCPTNE